MKNLFSPRRPFEWNGQDWARHFWTICPYALTYPYHLKRTGNTTFFRLEQYGKISEMVYDKIQIKQTGF
jgi:hypothetical protein